ncbi:MAG: (2Fe-2S)-binding protein [Kiritimatiellae bacterium]|jgi:carbon-monoxide dehydrogenase small subunit|nr:(2Fe-2S)-binding protein [Kiritimatiellia bacterium]MDD3440734.1 (2Fe-2S)-binding protein [Kiritimatiellia bacterium]MDD4118078.1 (2Fe-2S)-binding protein [Kiritimatiellia bacterium]NCC92959.1 (2Fe-2S)-binding protein [Opitutae bacterium]
MADLIQFTLNGTPQSVAIDPADKIIDVLREHLNLTGTKRGCDDGTCGACTIVLNGEAKRACLLPAAKLDGADVLTIEGLNRGADIHPIQKALIEAGAVQCGYCIPGIVMELYALYTKKPDADDGEIKTALSRHFCRCTGYEAIWEGAKLAQQYMQAKA